ncbi:DNA cytosine methyltransferase [Bdellovibrio sp.]|uniref:DNA cytosine methyltransferase n=1 Tax=Bdellovibrio sp. TaxID=28201 RepID=UPI003221CEC4
MSYTSVELCAGAGGAAVGLEQAHFKHVALVEIDKHACQTLRLNRPKWNVIQADLQLFSGKPFKGAALVSAGVPCPPFSKAGKQLGKEDERDLFPAALRIVSEVKPKAVMLENVRGLLDPIFKDYRDDIQAQLSKMGYISEWKLFNASDFGTSQLRPRVVLVALKKDYWNFFEWPKPNKKTAPTVGELLFSEMSKNGWLGATAWKKIANDIAPTIVGGSKKHGGPDLGPTRSKRAWEKLGVDGMGIANEPPAKDHVGLPRLTVKMAALLQGFPKDWQFFGAKTPAYRQVGNAFPPHVARAVGESIMTALEIGDSLLMEKTKTSTKQLEFTV